MIKKIGLGMLLAGLITILVAGGVIRTIDKTENVAESHGLEGRGGGNGQGSRAEGNDGKDVVLGEPAGLGQGRTGGQGNGGQGSGGGQQGADGGQQGAGSTERQYTNFEEANGDWTSVTGTIVQVPADDQDLMVTTSDGAMAKVGTGPGYMADQGFHLEVDEGIVVEGYWEGDEFKAGNITRLRDGAIITLRDQDGHPAWSGSGQRAAGQQGSLATQDQDQTGSPGGGSATGQADVAGWVVLNGWVVSSDDSALVVETEDGQEILIEGRPWRFAQEVDFGAAAGDKISLSGFYEGAEFEVGGLDNETTGLSVTIRQESGRPLWAGGGRRGS